MKQESITLQLLQNFTGICESIWVTVIPRARRSLKEKMTDIDKTGSRGSSLIDLGLDQIEVLPKKSRLT